MEPLHSEIRDNLDLVEIGNKKIYLVGTAHVSHSSVQLVEDVIREIQPDSVAVELCESRFKSLRDPDRWRNMDIVEVVRSGRAYVLMAQLVLAGFQRKIGSQLNIKPGAEMLRSIEIAEQSGCQTVLADREVKTTLKRTWASIGFFTGIKLIVGMVASLISREKVSAEEIESLKSKDMLSEALKEFSDKFPTIRKALIDERDQFLAAKIQDAPGECVVAVIGAGHVPGIKSYLGKVIDIAPLQEIPPKSLLSKIFGWSIPFLVAALVIYGFFAAGGALSLQMIEAWIWVTGFMGAVGSTIALAHPLTILSAFIATPIATLHPLIAAGWIAGLVEAWIRKPRVSDFETVLDDLASIKGIWTNRVTRILLVIAFTNIMATIGMIWGAKMIAELAILTAPAG